MKKKILGIVCFLAIAGVVYGIGLYNKQEEKRQDTSQQKLDFTEAAVDSAVSEEEEFLNRVVEDQDKVKQQGNIFAMDDYQVFGGFGYRILDFIIYDNYEAFKQSEDYDERNEARPGGRYEESTYIYVEMEVTSDAAFAERIYYSPVNIILARDGNADVGRDASIDFDCRGEAFYIGGVEHPAEGVGNRYNPLMQPGETITLQYCFECTYVDVDTGEHIKIEDVIDNPEYYVRITGDMTPGDNPGILSEDRFHIYFRCEPEGEK